MRDPLYWANEHLATLILLVSRRRSKIAMWILIAWFALSIPSLVQTIIRGLLLESNIIVVLGRIRVLQAIGQATAFALLFTASARRWMNRKDEKAA